MKPTIQPVTSLTGWKQFEEFELELYATNAPTAWTAGGLPTGVSIDPDTGKISGAMEVAGVWNIYVTASNMDGASEPLVFVLGCESSGLLHKDALIEVQIDAHSGEVSIPSGGGMDDGGAILTTHSGDDLLFRVVFKTGQTVSENDTGVLDLDLSALRMGVKQYDDEELLTISTATDNTGNKQGVGAKTGYILHVPLNNTLLKYAVEDGDLEGEVTSIIVVCEIERIESNDTGFGPADIVRTSKPFRMRIINQQLINS